MKKQEEELWEFPVCPKGKGRRIWSRKGTLVPFLWFLSVIECLTDESQTISAKTYS